MAKLVNHISSSPVKVFGSISERDDLDNMMRSRKESESFPVKFLAFVLVDLIPYNRRNEMISAFENLFSLPGVDRIGNIQDRIGDITKSGLAGFRANLGYIQNANKLSTSQAVSFNDRYNIYPDSVKAKLPDPIDRINVSIAQDVDFCYYAYYFCYLNEHYWNLNRDTYILSGDLVPYYENDRLKGGRQRGPDSDPTLEKYEKETTQFLSKFMNGLFLNNEYSLDKIVPSIRILSTPEIDLTNLASWAEGHWSYLEYLRMSPNCQKYKAAVVSLQTERIFQISNVPKGITILYSEKDVPAEGSTKYHNILSSASVINVAIMDYFLPLYWSNFNIFVPLESWKIKLNEKLTPMKFESLTLEELEDKVTEFFNLYGEFVVFSSYEKVNIRTARKNFDTNKRLRGPPSFTAYLYELDLFKDVACGIEASLNDERMLIDDIQRRINALIAYYRDKTNLKLSFTNLGLQKQAKRLTITIPIVGVSVSVLVPIIVRILWGL